MKQELRTCGGSCKTSTRVFLTTTALRPLRKQWGISWEESGSPAQLLMCQSTRWYGRLRRGHDEHWTESKTRTEFVPGRLGCWGRDRLGTRTYVCVKPQGKSGTGYARGETPLLGVRLGEYWSPKEREHN